MPHDGEDYVHRIGRTARAAAEGTAITFISEREQRKFAVIEKLLGKEVLKEKVPDQFGEVPVYSPGAGAPRQGQHKGKKPMHFNRNRPHK